MNDVYHGPLEIIRVVGWIAKFVKKTNSCLSTFWIKKNMMHFFMVMNNLIPFEIFNDLIKEIKVYPFEIFSDLMNEI